MNHPPIIHCEAMVMAQFNNYLMSEKYSDDDHRRT